MPSSILAGLLACNFIWAANPVFAKRLLASFDPVQTSWLRYSSSMLAFLVFAALRRGKPAFIRSVELSRREWGLLTLMAFASFCYTPLLQVTGLNSSQAMDNALIIVLEPLLSVALAALILRERMSRTQFLSLSGALLGFSLMSGLGPSTIAQGLGPRSAGNGLMLLSLLGDSLYTVLGSRLLRKVSPIPLFGTSLLIGLLVLTGITWGGPGLPSLESLSWSQVFAVFWVGPLGTALTFGYWAWALQTQPVSAMVPTLFVQPLFGMLLGFLWLGERLDAWQSLGAAILLTAVCWPAWKKIHFST